MTVELTLSWVMFVVVTCAVIFFDQRILASKTIPIKERLRAVGIGIAALIASAAILAAATVGWL